MRLLARLLDKFIHNGRLVVIDHDGTRRAFGTGENGPLVTIRLADARLANQLFFNPELVAGEAYMDGRLTIEDGGTIYDFLELFSVNRAGLASHPLQQVLRRVWRTLKRLHQFNPVGKAAEHARHHYDHPAAFYRLWLDETMSYSCGYFATPETPLAEAQRAKMRHIAAKLNLSPGMRVVEIGSGWGALACYLARTCGVQVTGLNVSREQIAQARLRAAAEGLADKVTFVEADYREFEGKFDRLVSVGMMEHVGVAHYDAFFAAVKRLLAPNGFALVHAIGRMSPPGSTAPFIRKYIFPGGYVPALSEVFASTERSGLWVADCEVLRLHYYWTIRNWRERFALERRAVVNMMSERFARMWEFYLAAVELGFLHGSNMVFQLALAERRDAVPVLRDYMVDAERALIAGEPVGVPPQ